MDTDSNNMLSGFQQSNKYSWKVKEVDVQELINAAVKTNDVDLLLRFVSNPPNDDSGTGWGPGAFYRETCKEVVLPYLAEHVNLKIAQTICNTLLENDPGGEDFYNPAFAVLNRAGALANEPVRAIIASKYAAWSVWKRSVKFVCDHGDKEAVSSIIEGMKKAHDHPMPWGSLVIEEVISVGIQALLKLDAPARADVFYELLSHENKYVKESVIIALEKYGDGQAVQALKKRLGGIFKKPETIPYIRNKIEKAIEKINSREK